MNRCEHSEGCERMKNTMGYVNEVHDDENDSGNSKHMRLVVSTLHMRPGTVLETRTSFSRETLRVSFPARARNLRSKPSVISNTRQDYGEFW